MINLITKHKRPRNLNCSLLCRQPIITVFLIIMEAFSGVQKLLHFPGPKLKRPLDPDLHARGGVTCLHLPNNNPLCWRQRQKSQAGRERGGAAGRSAQSQENPAQYKRHYSKFNRILASPSLYNH